MAVLATGGIKGLLKPGKGTHIPAAGRAIGFAPDVAETAISGMKGGGGHAIRHLEGVVIPKVGSLESRVAAFSDIAKPILTNPIHTAPWRVGATEGRAFLGQVDGKTVAIVVAKSGPQQGKVITSFIPDENQLSLMLSRK